jgi:glycosyltransferase involved in cell wall biosynthesis
MRDGVATPGPDGPRPLRIAYVGAMTSGGSERQLLLLAGSLPRDRFAVEFIVLGPATPQSDEAVAMGLPVHILGATRGRRRGPWIAAWVMARTFARYVRLTRARRYDVVDAWLFHAYVLAGLARPLARGRTLVAGRRSLSDYKASLSVPSRWADRFATRAADVLVANSDAVADDVVRRERVERDRIRVIRNAVSPAAAVSSEERAALRRAWDVPIGALVVGCVANPRPEKGLDVLLEALERAPLPGDVHVVVVGDGPERPMVERRIHELGLGAVVHLVGRVQDARPVYGAFDVLISPSRAEGMPNSVLEAAAAGLAIVATTAGGTAEIVADGRSGLLVPIEDPVALRAALDRVLTDAPLRAALGQAAREAVTERFGIDRLVRETGDLYRELVAAKRLR